MMKLHHIGVACGDIALEMENIRRIHDVSECSPVVFDPLQEAELALVTLADGTRIRIDSG